MSLDGPAKASPPRGGDEVLTGLETIERALGYTFRDRALLVTALTHRSFAHEALSSPCGDNESLEFLGDAVLSFLVASRLFHDFPGLDEGRLSKHKAAIERCSTLAEVARGLGLGAVLRLGRGEGRSGGSTKDKILSDALEALIAAVYIDGGLEAAQQVVDRTLGARLRALDADNPVNDYKSALQELTQSRTLGMPVYQVVEELGPDHDKKFRVAAVVAGTPAGEGCAGTKRGAQQVAARQALERLLRTEAWPSGVTPPPGAPSPVK